MLEKLTDKQVGRRCAAKFGSFGEKKEILKVGLKLSKGALSAQHFSAKKW
jgi:hypothetical protein